MHFLCELFRSRIIKFYVIWLKNVVFRLFAHSFRPRPPFNPIFSFSLKTHSELFVDRRSKSITISTVAAALQKIATRQAAGEAITGPKKIGCYGASYLYPMF